MSLLLSRRAFAKEDAPPAPNPPDVPPELLCPITLDLMRDPVVGPTGITYDRAAIEAWLLAAGRGTCPVTHRELRAGDLVPNHTLRRIIQAWCAAHSSHGAERLPSPRTTPATPAQVADTVAEVEAAAGAGDAVRCAEAARRVRRLATVAAGRNRRCLASAGAARALAAAFASFAPSAGDVLDDVLAALLLVTPMDDGAIAAVGTSSESVARLVAVASHGDLHRRLHAVVMLREIVTFSCTGYSGAGAIDLSTNVDAIIDVLVKTIRDVICPQATKACLVAAHHLACHADDELAAAARLATAGLVPVLVELLVDADRSTAEMALAAFDATLASGDGRARARADALAVPVLASKMFRVSAMATDLVVSALWRICKMRREDDDGMGAAAARRLAVVEALQAGVLQKLMLLLQVGCKEETKEKATEMLGLMVRYQAKGECIDTMDFRGLNRVS